MTACFDGRGLLGGQTDSLGRKQALMYSLYGLCACGAVSAVAPTAAVLGLGRFGSGVAIGGLVVAAFTHLVRLFLSLLALSLLMVSLLPSFSLSLLRNRSSPARSPIGHR